MSDGWVLEDFGFARSGDGVQIDDGNDQRLLLVAGRRRHLDSILHVDPLFNGAKVVANMRYGRRLDAREYLLLVLERGDHQSNMIQTRKGRD